MTFQYNYRFLPNKQVYILGKVSQLTYKMGPRALYQYHTILINISFGSQRICCANYFMYFLIQIVCSSLLFTTYILYLIVGEVRIQIAVSYLFITILSESIQQYVIPSFHHNHLDRTIRLQIVRSILLIDRGSAEEQHNILAHSVTYVINREQGGWMSPSRRNSDQPAESRRPRMRSESQRVKNRE